MLARSRFRSDRRPASLTKAGSFHFRFRHPYGVTGFGLSHKPRLTCRASSCEFPKRASFYSWLFVRSLGSLVQQPPDHILHAVGPHLVPALT